MFHEELNQNLLPGWSENKQCIYSDDSSMHYPNHYNSRKEENCSRSLMNESHIGGCLTNYYWANYNLQV